MKKVKSYTNTPKKSGTTGKIATKTIPTSTGVTIQELVPLKKTTKANQTNTAQSYYLVPVRGGLVGFHGAGVVPPSPLGLGQCGG